MQVAFPSSPARENKDSTQQFTKWKSVCAYTPIACVHIVPHHFIAFGGCRPHSSGNKSMRLFTFLPNWRSFSRFSNEQINNL